MKPIRPVIGWREWVALPELGVEAIKAKVDTGARTSALHAFDIERFARSGAPWVRFTIHPLQRNTSTTIRAEAPMIDERAIRNSSGKIDVRPVIETALDLLGEQHRIELTLTNRDEMGFRMLLGRHAVRRVYWIDPARSFTGGRPGSARWKAGRVEP